MLVALQADPLDRGSPDHDDDALVASWRRGDDGAFCDLVERHGPPLLGFLRHLLGDTGQAEDAWSETWLRLIRARDRYVPEGRFRAWLYTVARRCAKDQNRSHRRWLRLAARVVQHAPPAGASASPDARAIEDERALGLRSALGHLSKEHRTAVLLTYRQGLNSREVGEVMGLTSQQVRSRLTYARSLLGQQLGKEGEENGSSDGANGIRMGKPWTRQD